MSRERSIGGSPSTVTIGLSSTSIGTWQPAQPSVWNCSRPRANSSAKLVVGGGRKLPVLDQRLDHRHLEEREVRHHRGERPAAELLADAVAIGVGGVAV